MTAAAIFGHPGAMILCWVAREEFETFDLLVMSPFSA
jgi:hypothetical protein